MTEQKNIVIEGNIVIDESPLIRLIRDLELRVATLEAKDEAEKNLAYELAERITKSYTTRSQFITKATDELISR
jgi:hypothetical protein